MSSTLTRRSFFQQLKPSLGGKSAPNRRNSVLSSDLTAFVPDANNPWDEIRAGHLLRRTMMGPTWSDIEAIVALNDPGKAVDSLLSAFSTPAAPTIADAVREDPNSVPEPVMSADLATLESDASILRAWFAAQHQTASLSIQEKMAFFWNCHFTSAFSVAENDYATAQLLYRQNNLFRTFGNIQGGAQNGPLGNFSDLVKAVTLDGAMLVYLGGDQNSAGAPNENYAREVMELFTCGIGGGYTEADVQAGARILTGWRIPQFTQVPAPNGIFNYYFDAASHDIQDKLYLTQDFPAINAATNTQFLVQKNEIDRMVDVLFQQTGTSIATYISTKLYKFFVYCDSASVDGGVVSAMADLFIKSNWEILPVVSALLKSEHFFDNLNIGAQIKTPAEYDIGMARQIQLSMTNSTVDANMTNAGLQFFQPPNVSGWPGYHDWITTNTYPIRGSQATAAILAMDDAAALAFVNQFPAPTDVNLLSTAIGQLLLPRSLSTERETIFAQTLAGTTQTYEWPSILSGSPATAARNIRALLSYIVALPDFELC